MKQDKPVNTDTFHMQEASSKGTTLLLSVSKNLRLSFAAATQLAAGHTRSLTCRHVNANSIYGGMAIILPYKH
jgi:hypothetical protein